MLARLGGLLRGVRARIVALRDPRRLDRQLQEELRFHLEQQTAKNVRAGMSRTEAERAAQRALGNPGRIQEEHRDARGVRWIEELRQDLGYGVRRSLARPWVSAGTILTLAVGIGSMTTIYGGVAALVLEPLPFPELDRVVVLGEARRGASLPGEGWGHPGDYAAWGREPVFAELGGVRPWFVTMTGTEQPAEVFGYQVFGDYFKVLGVDAALGRTLAPDAGHRGEPETVLSHRFWRAHLAADPDVIGRVVRFEDREHVIVGVMPEGAGYPMGTDVWAAPTEDLDMSAPFDGRRLAVVGRLAPGVTLQQTRAALRLVAERTAEIDPEGHAELMVVVDSGAQHRYLRNRAADDVPDGRRRLPALARVRQRGQPAADAGHRPAT